MTIDELLKREQAALEHLRKQDGPEHIYSDGSWGPSTAWIEAHNEHAERRADRLYAQNTQWKRLGVVWFLKRLAIYVAVAIACGMLFVTAVMTYTLFQIAGME